MEELQKEMERLRTEIKKKVGRSMDTPSDYDYLSSELQANLKEYISPTTLKRFFNYIPNDVTTRTSTLSLLSRFVGYDGWADFIKCNKQEEEPQTITFYKEIGEGFADFIDIELIHNSQDGCCQIYKAKRFGKWHTLKTLKAKYREDKQYVERLRREFIVSYLLLHPDTIQTVSYEIVGELGWCIISRYIDGENLKDYIVKNKIIAKEFLPILKKICLAIDFVHKSGFTYNNIKYQNIIIKDASADIKLLDFSKTQAYSPQHNDYNDLVKLIIELNDIMLIKIKGIEKVLNLLNNKSKIKCALDIYNILSYKIDYTPYIVATCLIFTALFSSFLGYNLGQQKLKNYIYIDTISVDNGEIMDFSSSIVIFDTLSKLVIKNTQLECIKCMANIESIKSVKGQIMAINEENKKFNANKEKYPTSILNKYLKKQSPEYNLYKTSLIKLSEDLFSEFYYRKLDSLRIERIKCKQQKSSTISH